ncbi:hypothetical protein V7654_22825 [Bacillus sp. JJ1609]|uniref:hypothetical protein n=1 Tax=Bacillus sp. JJ1609 TaxID=3122977 RepID=UPI002FFF5A00
MPVGLPQDGLTSTLPQDVAIVVDVHSTRFRFSFDSVHYRIKSYGLTRLKKQVVWFLTI